MGKVTGHGLEALNCDLSGKQDEPVQQIARQGCKCDWRGDVGFDVTLNSSNVRVSRCDSQAADGSYSAIVTALSSGSRSNAGMSPQEAASPCLHHAHVTLPDKWSLALLSRRLLHHTTHDQPFYDSYIHSCFSTPTTVHTNTTDHLWRPTLIIPRPPQPRSRQFATP